MSLASETSIPETWFPSSSVSPSARVETGTMATSGPSASSPRASSRRRSPPETQARITSLTVASKTRPTSFTSSSGTERPAKRLRFDTAPLNEVRGAAKNPGGDCSPRPASSRLCIPRSATASTPACSVLSVAPGWRASDEAAWRSICVLDGNGAGSHSGGSATIRVRGVRSRNAASTDAPLTPSRMAWCTLATSAVRSPSSPSTTCISHSGRSGSSWRLMTPATNASSSACPPGRGQAGPAQVVVELEVGVVDPHRVVQAEGHPHGPLAQRGDQVQPLLNHPADLRVTGRRREERARALGRVEHQRDAHVHRRRRCLEREEGGVHADEWTASPLPS